MGETAPDDGAIFEATVFLSHFHDLPDGAACHLGWRIMAAITAIGLIPASYLIRPSQTANAAP